MSPCKLGIKEPRGKLSAELKQDSELITVMENGQLWQLCAVTNGLLKIICI